MCRGYANVWTQGNLFDTRRIGIFSCDGIANLICCSIECESRWETGKTFSYKVWLTLYLQQQLIAINLDGISCCIEVELKTNYLHQSNWAIDSLDFCLLLWEFYRLVDAGDLLWTAILHATWCLITDDAGLLQLCNLALFSHNHCVLDFILPQKRSLWVFISAQPIIMRF